MRATACKRFLESKNHRVDLVSINEDSFSKMSFFYQRVKAYLGDKESALMEEIARRVETKLKKGNYEAVIGIESLFSYVLTKNLDCLKVFSWEAMGADEVYFASSSSRTSDFEHVRRFREMELEICRCSNYVIFPWETTENYVRKNIYDGPNFLTVRYGCFPKGKPASFFFPPSVVSIGCLGGYWSNTALLSFLTRISPYRLDVYGSPRPHRKYRLKYKGFAPSLDVLYNYQFGLNTVSKDVFRRNHFSSRILTYLAYGLPVLSPEWMQLSYELKGCLPYNEKNFVDLINQYSERNLWEELSREAYAQAHELDWNITLKPLEKIFSK